MNYMLRLEVDMHELKTDRNQFSNWNPSRKLTYIYEFISTFLYAVINICVNYFLMEKSFENASKHVRSIRSRNGTDWYSVTEYETMYERMPKTAFESAQTSRATCGYTKLRSIATFMHIKQNQETEQKKWMKWTKWFSWAISQISHRALISFESKVNIVKTLDISINWKCNSKFKK